MGYGFRKNLRNELDYQGITIKELSARTGIPVATLDCYLGTRATIPSVDAAYKIARALQVSVEYLITGEDIKKDIPLKKRRNEELQNLVNWIESLNSEQRKAINNVLSIFSKQENRNIGTKT